MTATSERLSTTSSSTTLLAIILRVQVFLPSGGVLQAMAIMWASTSPVIFDVTGGVCRFLRCNTRSRPCVAYCFLIL